MNKSCSHCERAIHSDMKICPHCHSAQPLQEYELMMSRISLNRYARLTVSGPEQLDSIHIRRLIRHLELVAEAFEDEEKELLLIVPDKGNEIPPKPECPPNIIFKETDID